MKPNFWTPDTAAKFSEASPEFMRHIAEYSNEEHYYNDAVDAMRYFISLRDIYAITFYAIEWWHQNMSLLDKIILKVLPTLSPFFRGVK